MANTVNASEAGAGFQPTEPGLSHATIGSGRQTTRVCNAEFNQGGLATTIYIYIAKYQAKVLRWRNSWSMNPQLIILCAKIKMLCKGTAVEELLVHESTTHNTLREKYRETGRLTTHTTSQQIILFRVLPD